MKDSEDWDMEAVKISKQDNRYGVDKHKIVNQIKICEHLISRYYDRQRKNYQIKRKVQVWLLQLKWKMNKNVSTK